MNKLELTRGVGLSRQKFNFFQDGIREGFIGILSAFGLNQADGFKLSGCGISVVDNSGELTIDIDEGYIAFQGEVCYVAAQQIIKQAAEVCYFEIDSQKVDNIPGQIKGGGTFDMQEQRRAKLVVSSSTPGDYMPYNAPDFDTKIRNAATDIGEIKFLDPRPQGKTLADFFNMSTGVGLPDKKYAGWVILGIHNDYKADYAGRMIVGLDPADSDFDAVGKKGGAKTHTLTMDELPDEGVSILANNLNYQVGSADTNVIAVPDSGQADLGNKTESLGNGDPHENMSPYIVAAQIMRVA